MDAQKPAGRQDAGIDLALLIAGSGHANAFYASDLGRDDAHEDRGDQGRGARGNIDARPPHGTVGLSEAAPEGAFGLPGSPELLLMESADALGGVLNGLLQFRGAFGVLYLALADFKLAGAQGALVELLRVFADRRVPFLGDSLDDGAHDLRELLAGPLVPAALQKFVQRFFAFDDFHLKFRLD